MRTQHRKALLALCAIALLSVGSTACGGASKTTDATSSTQAVATNSTNIPSEKRATTPTDKDKDADSSGRGRYDSDDSAVLSFGHAASTSEKEQITSLIRNYYEIAAEQNGTKACALLYSILAESVPETYGTSPPGPSYARGKTCPQVLTAFFKHFHQQIVAKLPKLKVSRVRIKERQGVAVLSFGTLPESEMRVVREGHIWRIISVVDTELP